MADGPLGELLHRHGVPEMTPEAAITALHQAVDHGEAFLTIADIAWERFSVAFTATRPGPLISDLPDVRRLAAAEAMGSVEAGDGPVVAGAARRAARRRAVRRAARPGPWPGRRRAQLPVRRLRGRASGVPGAGLRLRHRRRAA
ncbi:hypothetical protein V2I01_31380 [Micromonospora sp. BRA006-A]|nr:hypothetical protein [Micromonospora sp. BRA006-A]